MFYRFKMEINWNYYTQDTGVPILKSEERKVMQVSGERAVFTPQEIKSVKDVYKSGFKVLGYMDVAKLDYLKWFRSDGYFLYPDNDQIEGSQKLFTALLKRCHALQVFGYLLPTSHKNATIAPKIIIQFVVKNVQFVLYRKWF